MLNYVNYNPVAGQQQGRQKEEDVSMSEMTIKDIAKRCGVGASTVSRAINDHPNINPATKEMVMAVIRETGFVPNNSARNLKRTEANCIAVLIKGITNPFFSQVIRIIEEYIKDQHFTMVMQHVESYESELDVALKLVKEKRLRGIIFLGGDYVHDEKKLSMLNVPFVFSTIGTVAEETGSKNYSNVSVDDRAESRKMTEYLIGLGHRRIAFITENSQGESIGRLRLLGYLDALKEHGIETDQGLIREITDEYDPYSVENGYRMTKELLASGETFTAVYAIADTLAVGACRALFEAGKRVPEDVSVAGFDGIPLGEYLVPKLTTIRQPVEAMADRTVKLLFEILNGKKEHEHLIFPAVLQARESTAQAEM